MCPAFGLDVFLLGGHAQGAGQRLRRLLWTPHVAERRRLGRETEGVRGRDAEASTEAGVLGPQRYPLLRQLEGLGKPAERQPRVEGDAHRGDTQRGAADLDAEVVDRIGELSRLPQVS